MNNSSLSTVLLIIACCCFGIGIIFLFQFFILTIKIIKTKRLFNKSVLEYKNNHLDIHKSKLPLLNYQQNKKMFSYTKIKRQSGLLYLPVLRSGLVYLSAISSILFFFYSPTQTFLMGIICFICYMVELFFSIIYYLYLKKYPQALTLKNPLHKHEYLLDDKEINNKFILVVEKFNIEISALIVRIEYIGLYINIFLDVGLFFLIWVVMLLRFWIVI